MSRVHDILGITERDLVRSTNKQQFVQDNNFVNVNTGKLTPFGIFQLLSIGQLKDMVNWQEIPNTNPIKIQIKTGVDIGALQGTLKTSDQAMVQVASNFNCLEVASRNHYPDNGKLIEEHQFENTQGPAATFGPLAAAIYRCHFVFKDTKEGKYYGQTCERQVNLLDAVTEYFSTPVNGKLTLTGHKTPIPQDYQFIVDKIKVGLHTNCAVMYDRRNTFSAPYNVIDQVFNSTINMKSYGFHPDPNIIQKVLLQAAYEGIYLCAILRNTKVLYLTLIGGGVFKNSLDLIGQAIKSAHEKYAPYSNLQEVYLCLYDSNTTIAKYLD